MQNLPSLTEVDKEIQRRKLTRSQLSFTQHFFEAREGIEFIPAPFHPILCDTLDAVYAGEIKRLIINIPPGTGKTDVAVVNFIARGLAINPRARFLHISYAQPLALDNSSKVKDLIQLEEFQNLWPLALRADTTAKGLWRTSEGGALRAASSGEPITGFRAGYADDTKFTGAMIIDDPLKPDDALSDTERTKINKRYTGVFKSRLMHKDVPVIVIMQRLHIDDFTANLLNGASGEKWHHLNLPVWNDGKPHPESFSHGVEIPNELPAGSLWPWKFPESEIEVLKADEYTYNGQYQQAPVPLGGALFKSTMVQEYDPGDQPRMRFRLMIADTAMTGKTSSDWSAFGVYGWGIDSRLYLLDMLRIRMNIPEMENAAFAFWDRHKKSKDAHTRVELGVLRKFIVENKASGVGLIQRLANKRIPYAKIERSRDKVARALDTVPQLAASPLMVPRGAPWLPDFKNELMAFTALGDAKHDDQVDTLMDAVEETMIRGTSLQDVL